MPNTLTPELYELITQAKMKQGNNWGCGVVLVDPVSNKILIGERTDTHNFCTPGGKVEVGETVVNGVTRECLEESNLKLRSVKFMGYRVHTSPNGKNWVSFMFYSDDFEGDVKPQESEIVSWNWVDHVELAALDIFPATDASLQVACKLGLIDQVDNLLGVKTETINGDGNGDNGSSDGYVEQELDAEIQVAPAVFGADVIPATHDLYHHGHCDECCSYSSCGADDWPPYFD